MAEKIVTISTNKGNIILKLFPDEAPLAVASFLFLIKRGFYNGLTFHRVIDKFMIQGGCPVGDGTGDPPAIGINAFEYQGAQISYPFKDEFQNNRKFDKPGILALANAGPNTNGSQFFITHVPTPWLNGQHTIFGEVLNSQTIVDAIRKGDRIISISEIE
jgi:peptidyl-prolyl cis-trans isomerase B (cyclophilin B)